MVRPRGEVDDDHGKNDAWVLTIAVPESAIALGADEPERIRESSEMSANSVGTRDVDGERVPSTVSRFISGE